MRDSAIILAALLTATPALAAEQCVKVPGAKYGDTAHCFLRIDGKVIIDGTCDIEISGDTRYWAMKGMAEVYMNHELLGRPFYAQRIQKRGKQISYGRVEVVDDRQEHICWGNKRFRMCFSQPYLACDPELVKAFGGTNDHLDSAAPALRSK